MDQEAGAEVAIEAPKTDVPAEAPKVEESPAAEGDDPKKRLTGYQRKLLKKDRVIADLQAQLATRATPAPTQSPPPEPPKAENFQNQDGTFRTDDYFKAMVSHHGEEAAKRILTERDTQAAKERDTQALQSKLQKYEQAKEEIRSRHPDFDQAIEDYDGPQTPQILMALLDTDAPADVALYLAKNPEEADKMDGMGVVALNKFMAKIEARLEIGKSQAPAAKTTNAPPPVSPVKSSAKTDTTVAPEDPDEYRNWRARQRGK